MHFAQVHQISYQNIEKWHIHMTLSAVILKTQFTIALKPMLKPLHFCKELTANVVLLGKEIVRSSDWVIKTKKKRIPQTI